MELSVIKTPEMGDKNCRSEFIGPGKTIVGQHDFVMREIMLFGRWDNAMQRLYIVASEMESESLLCR